MRDILTAAFPAVSENSCLEEFTRRTTYVQDTPNGRCVIVDNSQPYQFFIENIDNTEVGFLAVDKCVFNDSSEHKKCDFIFFTEAIFAFVEIKDTANRQPQHKRTAKEQLESTIVKFKEKIDLSNYKKYAIIAWRYRRRRPAASTAMQAARLEFLTKYNTELQEGDKFKI